VFGCRFFAQPGAPLLTRLDQAFRSIAPRVSPLPTPAASLIIHGAVLVVWILLFTRAFGGGGVFAWAIGLVYVGYDTLLQGFVFVQTMGLWGGQAAPAAGAQRATVGVIIAAHNEAAILPRTLRALAAQSDAPDAILIADDGSHDATPRALGAHGLLAPAIGGKSVSLLDPSLCWLRLPHRGKARTLNEALGHIDTDIVLTVDADTLLAPGAIAAMRAAFTADPGLVAATGILVPTCAPGPGGRIFAFFQTYEYIRNFLSRFAWARLNCLLLISGAFAGYRRAALLEVGGFDPDSFVEDYELTHRLLRHAALLGLGWRSTAVGRAVATTDAPASPGAFLRQRRRWFGGFLQTQFWYRDMVGNRRYGWLGTAMLPVKAADTLQPIYGLTAFGLLVWFLAHGEFGVVLPAAGVMLGKIGVDLGFHLYSVSLYRRWTGDVVHNRFSHAFLAALAEPFSFQLFRHGGAALGWVTFLTGQRSWGTKSRFGDATALGAE
jgi:cellulose synthase/poly-beta-1,6-N-acetylglucosamine synthase-like glycosyltransferase